MARVSVGAVVRVLGRKRAAPNHLATDKIKIKSALTRWDLEGSFCTKP